jgi:hypothetical protein
MSERYVVKKLIRISNKDIPTKNNKQRKHHNSKRVKPVKVCLPIRTKPDNSFRYVMDIVTKYVHRYPKNVAYTLVNSFEHFRYCTKRDYRYFKHNEQPKRVGPQPSLFWQDVSKIHKDEDGNVIESRYSNYLPKVSTKDKVKDKSEKDLSRHERRRDRHKVRLNDMFAHHQTIVILPEYDKTVYHVNKWKHCKNKSKVIEKAKSKLKTEKYDLRQIVFDYEYVPKTFSSRKHPEIVPILRLDGEQAMKKIYVGKRNIHVTITEFSRNIYKTIITKQYPNSMSKKRAIVKKNIEFLKQAQTGKSDGLKKVRKVK